jgi:hypothetical protein
MTLAPLLARLERGFHWCVRKVKAAVRWLYTKAVGARPYRFAGEEAAHADQLRETQVSLALMASAGADDPDQQRMATDIEDGMEKRLAVLLDKPLLSLAEKRERDSIQAALAAKRRGDLPAHLVAREPAGPARFAALGAVAGIRPWMIWTGAVVLLLGALGIQTGRIESAKADLREARAENRQLETEIMEANAVAQHFRDQALEADRLSQATAANIEAERARRLRAEREARSIRNAMEQARAGNAVDYGFGGVRDDGPATPGPSGGDAPGNRSR